LLKSDFSPPKNNSLKHAKKYLKNACKVIKCKKEGGIDGK
jgi:hypothetical protein